MLQQNTITHTRTHTHIPHLRTDVLQQVSKPDASPVAGAHCTGSPVEPDRLLVHVLLFPPAHSSAAQQHISFVKEAGTVHVPDTLLQQDIRV